MTKESVKRKSKNRRQKKRQKLKRVLSQSPDLFPSSPTTSTSCASPFSDVSSISNPFSDKEYDHFPVIPVAVQPAVSPLELKQAKKYISARQVQLSIASRYSDISSSTESNFNTASADLDTYMEAKTVLAETLCKDKFFAVFLKWQEASKLKAMAEKSVIYYNQFV